MAGPSTPSRHASSIVAADAATRRTRALHTAAVKGAARWRSASRPSTIRPVSSPPATDSPRPSEPGRLVAMPRRKFLTPRLVEAAPPQMRVVAFRSSFARTLGRLWHWAFALFQMAALVAWDHLHGTRLGAAARDSPGRGVCPDGRALRQNRPAPRAARGTAAVRLRRRAVTSARHHAAVPDRRGDCDSGADDGKASGRDIRAVRSGTDPVQLDLLYVTRPSW